MANQHTNDDKHQDPDHTPNNDDPPWKVLRVPQFSLYSVPPTDIESPDQKEVVEFILGMHQSVADAAGEWCARTGFYAHQLLRAWYVDSDRDLADMLAKRDGLDLDEALKEFIEVVSESMSRYYQANDQEPPGHIPDIIPHIIRAVPNVLPVAE